MPELPDLHVYALNLNKLVTDKVIAAASVAAGRRVGASPAAFARAAQGARILSVGRSGKELRLRLSSAHVIGVHLMLNGQMRLSSASELEALKGRVASLAFEDGGALSVCDASGLCRVALNPLESAVPDVMSGKFTRAYLAQAARRNALLLAKELLIDQKIMRGIGNAYADEILWRARISPQALVGKIPEAALDELFAAIGAVLSEAIEHILRVAPDAICGEERSFLRVHNPARKETEDGEPILVAEIAGKRTYYTASQRRFLG